MDDDVGDDVSGRKWGQYMVLSHRFCTKAVLGGGDAIKPGGTTCILYDGETAIFPGAIVRLSKGFRY